MTTGKSLKEQIRPLSDPRSVNIRTRHVPNTECVEFRFSETPDNISCNETIHHSQKYHEGGDKPKCLKSSKDTNANACKETTTLDSSKLRSLECANDSSRKSSESVKSKQFNCKTEKKSSLFYFPVQTNLQQTEDIVSDDVFSDLTVSDNQSRSFICPTNPKNLKGESTSSEFKELFPSFGKHNSMFSKSNDDNSPNQMKTKLRSMWNNMKYGWRVKREANLKTDSAAWLLGRCYHNKLNDGTLVSPDVSKQLKLDILSKIWFSYRINFPSISGTEFISDSGWGCMLRCGQMMMAQALICHFLHRDWRIVSDSPLEMSQSDTKEYKMILRWFGDTLSEISPFSLHNLVSLGENYGRKAGDWYGPTHAAQVLRDALHLSQTHNPQLKDICMYAAFDGIVFKQDIEDLCRVPSKCELLSAKEDKHKTSVFTEFPPETSKVNSSSESNTFLENCVEYEDACPSYSDYGPPSFNSSQRHWKSLILFVSVRLGHDKINPFYIPCLKNLLTYEQCIGIIGGRPKHALYFIGWQDDKLIHLDPHACQPAVDVDKEDFNVKSFHSSSIRMISFTEMDPSCAIGFYFKREEEYLYFVEKFPEITAPLKRNLDYPVFALVEGRRADVEEVDSFNADSRSSFSHVKTSSFKDEDDGYILL